MKEELEKIVQSYYWVGPKEGIIANPEKIFWHHISGVNCNNESTKLNGILFRAGTPTLGMKVCHVDDADYIILANSYSLPSSKILKTQTRATHVFFLNKEELRLNQLTPLDFTEYVRNTSMTRLSLVRGEYKKYKDKFDAEKLHSAWRDNIKLWTENEKKFIAMLADEMFQGNGIDGYCNSDQKDLLIKYFCHAMKLSQRGLEYSCQESYNAQEKSHWLSVSPKISDAQATRKNCGINSIHTATHGIKFYLSVVDAIAETRFQTKDLLFLAERVRSDSDTVYAKQTFNVFLTMLHNINSAFEVEHKEYSKHGSPRKVEELLEQRVQWETQSRDNLGITDPQQIADFVRQASNPLKELQKRYNELNDLHNKTFDEERRAREALKQYEAVADRFGERDAIGLEKKISSLPDANRNESKRADELAVKCRDLEMERSRLQKIADSVQAHTQYHATGAELLAAETPEALRDAIAALRLQAAFFAEVGRRVTKTRQLTIDLRYMRELEEKVRSDIETQQGGSST